jgi:two-component system sensor histidine kinase YesM
MAFKHIHQTISGRLIRFFALVIILPLYIFSFGLLFYTRASILEQTSRTGQNAVTQIAENISRQFLAYQDLSRFIAADQQLQRLDTYNDVNQINQDKQLLDDITMLLRGYRLNTPDVEMVAIALKNNLIFSTDIDEAIPAQVETYQWYRQSVETKNQVMTQIYAPGESPFPTRNDRLTETIAQFYPMQDRSGQTIGVVVVLLYNHVFEQAIRNSLGNERSFVYITDHLGKVVYSPIIQNIPEVVATNDYLLLTESVTDTNWTLHGMVYVGDTNQQILVLASKILGSLVIISILMIISAILTGRSIVQPVHSLQVLAQKVKLGDFSGRFKGQGSDEIQELGNAFNAMSMNLQKLIDQVYREQKLKREAELAALQANIKPHFLYHALDTVSWMARDYKAKDIVTTVDALSTFFRIALSRGSDFISVQQEIKHVESYLIIQKVRYENLLNFEINLESSCADLLTIKMILQPLVENAIYHGIKECGHDGIISIRIWQNTQEKCLYLAVEDNGIGMKPERLSYVQSCLSSGHKDIGSQDRLSDSTNPYGILNVHHRISLNFGEAYGLSLQSVFGEGTVALIRHPIIHSHEKT